MTKKQQAMVEDILENFDFECVHDVMKYLNWEWKPCNGVPTIYQLIKYARKLLESVAESYNKEGQYHCTCCGGFNASCNESGDLELAFYIAEYGSISYFFDNNGKERE